MAGVQKINDRAFQINVVRLSKVVVKNEWWVSNKAWRSVCS